MPLHPHDLNLIPYIVTQMNILVKHHPTYKTILAWDFNINIFLQGHTHEGTRKIPTREDREWARHMQTLTLHPIQNNETLPTRRALLLIH